MRCGRTKIRILLLRRSKDMSPSIPIEWMKWQSNFQLRANRSRVSSLGDTIMVFLTNKTALVTGASRATGRATASVLANAGAQLLVHYGRSGFPINVNGEVIGAIGVSGAPTVQNDVDCARATNL
jgi:Haem-degrading